MDTAERDSDSAEKKDGSSQAAPEILEKSTIVGSRKDDGTITISFKDNDLEAIADFHPPMGNGQALTPDYISTMLDRLSITFGVNYEAIQEATLECNLNRKTVHDVVVARGEKPVEEVREYFEANPAFRSWPRIPDGDVPRIDYREISPFVLVKKGQILAKQRPKIEGKDGTNVHGETIPHTFSNPQGATSGPNTKVSGDVIVASCEGRLVEKGTELSVEEILQVKGTVGYKTGHILFPGDVIIDGAVADGFKVYAGGSIVAKQTFDATEVVTKKDLIVAGGIVGRIQASIKVGGSLRAKFIQNCRVASRGPVIVGAAVVNSRIYTLDKLDLGDKGRLIGGEIFAVQGVRAMGIGSEGGAGTKLHCGVDFTIQQELDRANEKMRIYTQKQAKLRELLSQQPNKDQAKIDVDVKLTTEINALASRIGEMLGKLDANDGATVEVLGEIRPGTLIEICHIAYFTDQTYKKVRFRLDKTHGRLIHENL